MIKVYWLSLKPETPTRDYWDYGMLQDYFNNEMWTTGLEFEQIDSNKIEKGDFACVVVAARHHKELVKELNKELSKLKRCVLFLMGDEESEFPVENIKHNNINVWVMSPRPNRHENYNKMGTGYPIHISSHLNEVKPEKTVTVFFSGQLTHRRRFEMWENLQEYELQGNKPDIHGTKGFTQGFEPKEYYKRMARAKIAPAPSGPETPDSFRLFEALECMAVPIADEIDPKGQFDGYWNWFFDDADLPFPLIKEYDNLVGLIYRTLEDYDSIISKQTAWWIKEKRKFANTITNQIKE